jgi:hypothetical protein
LKHATPFAKTNIILFYRSAKSFRAASGMLDMSQASLPIAHKMGLDKALSVTAGDG